MSYETKILPSGIVIEDRPNKYEKYCWYIEGTYIIHNEDEPAIEYKNGNKCWYQHNKYHRTDGPAIEYTDGHKYYWINGDRSYEEEEYWNHPKVKEYMYLKEHPELECFI